MRYAIVSDIHANIQAWNAVLQDIGANRIDRIVCLGDIVGYGPHPAETLASVYSRVDTFVLGNHDAVICGKLSADCFNTCARQSIDWTARQLDRKAVQFLATLPLTLTGDGFRCAHGDLAHPAAFNYIIEPNCALASWEAQPEPLMFVGHTHSPGIFVTGTSGTPHLLHPQDFVLESGKRYIVNVGSVGYPRDGDARASYAIFDTREQSVVWRRIPFDLDAYRSALQQAGLPTEHLIFLKEDPRRDIPPVREMLNFAPPTRLEDTASTAVQEMHVTDRLKRSASRWRNATLILLAVALPTLAAVGAGAWFSSTRTLVSPSQPLSPQLVPVSVNGEHNMAPPIPAPAAARNSLDGWRLHLGNRRAQHAMAGSLQQERMFLLVSEDAESLLRLEAPPLTITDPKLKLVLRARFRKSDGFKGHVAIDLSLTKVTPDGGEEHVPSYVHKEPRIRRNGGWMEARVTTDFPAGTREVAFAITGRFIGTVEITQIQITRKD